MKQKGFTLVELILTMVIISTGLFGIMVLYNNAAHSVMEGDTNLMATFLARERLEQLINDKVQLGYDHLANSNYTTTAPVTVGNHQFMRSFNIYEVGKDDLVTPQVGSGFKRIDMMMIWGPSAGQFITIPTVLTDY